MTEPALPSLGAPRLVIRGARFPGDIAVEDGRVSEIGDVGRRHLSPNASPNPRS